MSIQKQAVFVDDEADLQLAIGQRDGKWVVVDDDPLTIYDAKQARANAKLMETAADECDSLNREAAHPSREKERFKSLNCSREWRVLVGGEVQIRWNADDPWCRCDSVSPSELRLSPFVDRVF